MIVTAVITVPSVHEQVDDWAGEEKQPGQSAHDVSAVLGPEEEAGNHQERTERQGDRRSGYGAVGVHDRG